MLVSENSLLSKNSHKSSFNNDNNSVSYPSRTIVHPKLEMTEPGDADEQEADAAANEVMSGKVFRKFSGGGAGGGMAVSSQMESQLNQLQGGGQVMPDGLRGMMERGFDRDFSQVRLHTDGEAAGLSSSIHAKAFTHGNDIYFNQGQYAPETSEGQRLVAHELAHVAQGGKSISRQCGNKDGWKYIKEPDWISGKVLTFDAQKKLWENYEDKSKKKPITVVLYTSHLDACHGEYESSCPFEERSAIKADRKKREEKNEPIPDYSNLELSGLITSKDEETNVYFIQGLYNPTPALEKLVTTYGYLQNLIIAGHANFDFIDLNSRFSLSVGGDSFDSFFETVKTLFKKTDDETGKTKHSILLAECLTGSNPTLGIANSIKCIMGSLDVKVIANRASVFDLHQEYVRDNGYLIFKNNNDQTSPVEQECINQSGIENITSHYEGGNQSGILMDIMLRIYFDSPLSRQDYAGSYFKIKGKERNELVWYTRDNLFDFLDRKYNNSIARNKYKMLSFLKMLYEQKLRDSYIIMQFPYCPHTYIDRYGDTVALDSFLDFLYDVHIQSDYIKF